MHAETSDPHEAEDRTEGEGVAEDEAGSRGSSGEAEYGGVNQGAPGDAPADPGGDPATSSEGRAASEGGSSGTS